MKSLRTIPIVVLLAAMASPAFAHIGFHEDSSLISGFVHPLSGIDHVLAMVSVGLFALRLGGRALWLIPAAFVGVMVIGGALGSGGVELPYVEPVIALSVIGLGALLVFDVRPPLVVSMALVGGFALFHGHAHGTEGAHLPGFAGYAAGFIAATTLCHLAGLAIGIGLERGGARISEWGRPAVGAVGCIAGAMLLAG